MKLSFGLVLDFTLTSEKGIHLLPLTRNERAAYTNNPGDPLLHIRARKGS